MLILQITSYQSTDALQRETVGSFFIKLFSTDHKVDQIVNLPHVNRKLVIEWTVAQIWNIMAMNMDAIV